MRVRPRGQHHEDMLSDSNPPPPRDEISLCCMLYAGEIARIASCGGDPRLSDTVLDA